MEVSGDQKEGGGELHLVDCVEKKKKVEEEEVRTPTSVVDDLMLSTPPHTLNALLPSYPLALLLLHRRHKLLGAGDGDGAGVVVLRHRAWLVPAVPLHLLGVLILSPPWHRDTREVEGALHRLVPVHVAEHHERAEGRRNEEDEVAHRDEGGTVIEATVLDKGGPQTTTPTTAHRDRVEVVVRRHPADTVPVDAHKVTREEAGGEGRLRRSHYCVRERER